MNKTALFFLLSLIFAGYPSTASQARAQEVRAIPSVGVETKANVIATTLAFEHLKHGYLLPGKPKSQLLKSFLVFPAGLGQNCKTFFVQGVRPPFCVNGKQPLWIVQEKRDGCFIVIADFGPINGFQFRSTVDEKGRDMLFVSARLANNRVWGVRCPYVGNELARN